MSVQMQPARGIRMSGVDAEWVLVGGRLREARRAAGLSIQSLAAAVGVSASHISQVERGLGSFSAAVLYSVASTLDISLDSLFKDPHESISAGKAPSAVDSGPSLENSVLRAQDRPSIKLQAGPRWQRLTRHTEAGAEFLDILYEPGDASSENSTFVRHSGREFGLVLSGDLTVQVGFETVILGAGDSISFDSTVPHRFANLTAGPVRAIWVVREDASPQDPLAVTRSAQSHAESHFPG